MTRFPSYRVSLFFLVIVLVVSLQPFFAVAQTCEESIGKMVSVQGTVESKKAGGTQWQPVKLNDKLCPGDTIRVLNNSRAELALANQSVLRINENTTITLEGVDEDRTTLVDLLKGAALFFSRGTRKLKVKTQYAIFGVRGTEFFIRVEERQAFMSVFEGTVLAENQIGSLTLKDGESTIAAAGKAPVLTVVARPRDAVQWALYYPPVIYFPPEKSPALLTDDPRFLTYRASQLLSVGRVGEAKADIDKALRIDPNFSDALALLSIIAVVQNDKETAFNQAQKAVTAEPQSATAQIALSYARQARFDLEGARTSIEAAVKLDPGNAIAWARLADLQASFGELGKALEAAKKAASLAPDLALTQTILGFAFLTQVNINESMTAFEKAITLDQAAPLPRLGLGLAKIRKGDLDEGGREIEIAAGLDSSNSLIRSYLGKTYYEEKRTELDGREYATAKKLDPNDPTPWFYDAIRLQTVNRPVEALHNYQKAIELNDNRAIYRSKLLLDSDLAARQSSLARIYNNLGFQQRALVEGWQSVNSDPSNFSAHRFLADSYAALPRHEIARVSELLQSQLLQPINITPIQPTLAESNLFLISSQGPSIPGFNTYNPLFNRNQAVLQADGLIGSNSTVGAEGVASGTYDKLSLSAGYTHFKTDGWRTNADQTDSIADIFAQYQLTYKTSIQAELRRRKIDQGQLDLLFDPNISPDFRREQQADIFRLGFHHAFSAHNDVIVSVISQDIDFEQNQVSGTPLVNTVFKEKRDGYLAELQHLFQRNMFNIVSGAGYLNQDFNQNTVIDILPFSLPPLFPGLPQMVIDPDPETIPQENNDIRRANFYSYAQIHVSNSLSVTVGLSADFLKIAKQFDSNQLNPKLGFIWKLFPETILRGAVFREQGIRLEFNQTIEPTQVAGFNQFYDDINGSDSWRYGAAVDHKFSENLFGGIEYSQRDLDVPRLADTELRAEFFDWHEQFGRAYLYKTIGPWFALSAEYLYERFDREDEPLRRGIVDVKTHRVPLGFSFFHPSGLSAGLKSTFVNQSGKFQARDSDDEFSDEDNFWVLDMSVSYRLPKRFGLVSLGANNIFDKHFRYQDTDPANSSFIPRRFVFAKLTLSL